MSAPAEEEKSQIPQDLQAQILSALSSSTSGKRTRPQGSSLASFQSEAEVLNEDELNKYNLLCPRDGCGSLILLKGVAKRVEKDTVEPIDSTTHPLPPSLPAIDPASSTSWWSISGSPMVFENISFSKSIQGADGKTKKLLACAECDLGPLGWAVDTDYWLSTNRVSYKTS